MKRKVILTIGTGSGVLAMKGEIVAVDVEAGTLSLGVGKVRGASRTVSMSLITKVIPTQELVGV